MIWRRLLLGDWHPLFRDPLDVLRLAFIVGAIAFAVMGRSTAISLAAASALLVLARFLDLPRPFDLSLILAMFLVSWGTALSLYGRFERYDDLVHLLAPLFYAPVIYIVLVRLDILSDLREAHAAHHMLGIFLVTLAIGVSVSAAYEVVEWASDSALGTDLVQGESDPGSDLFAAVLGSALGGILLVCWSAFGWGTTRRVPSDILTKRLSQPPRASTARHPPAREPVDEGAHKVEVPGHLRTTGRHKPARRPRAGGRA